MQISLTFVLIVLITTDSDISNDSFIFASKAIMTEARRTLPSKFTVGTYTFKAAAFGHVKQLYKVARDKNCG